MASGRWTTHRAEVASLPSRALRRVQATKPALRLVLLLALQACAPALWAGAACAPSGPPAKPVYLTFDTGHMAVAPLIAEVLKKHEVKVTFFAANEPTQSGNGSLGSAWAAWWQARAGEGHDFASHTYDHTYWRADVPGDAAPRFRVRPSAGPRAGQDQIWTAAQYCGELAKAASRLQELTGRAPLPLFRAPGGKTSPALLQAARDCGFAHVGWAPAGFLGDELPSDRFPNAQLLDKALSGIQAGDILVAHLGIWSRQDPWAPAVLEPLITGLQARGFCFASLREHPQFKPWIEQQAARQRAVQALPAGGLS